ncbi:24231_t:CDS:1 [Gigaspora rosea]|nr:24231_t:CDS:1 [Gigaspora rosea]
MVSIYLCYLCLPNLRYLYQSQSSLVKHEKTKHQNNKVILHIYTLIAPSSYNIEQFRNEFIIQVKKRLQFGQSVVKRKTIQLEPFSEGLFITLFRHISTFYFIASQKKYIVSFSGSAGYKELGSLLNDNKWSSKEDGLGMVAYVLMENKIGTYQVDFIWKEHVYKKHHYPLLCGLMTCSFKIDVQDFISE